eukprot:TRINITY_DN4083_c0_g1_i2.p5 TRINITY_DN4083_c0_g1~~TRINITY_DN4083_c0_g1_i2.p5  ORF type:complete len:107 (+),score=22.89 TRINITY_DN4083_c0_g1_i2:49-369(+)
MNLFLPGLISLASFCSTFIGAFFFFFFLMIRRPPRSTHCISSAASDVYKRQVSTQSTWERETDKRCCPSFLFQPFPQGLHEIRQIDAEKTAFRKVCQGDDEISSWS